MGGIGVARCIDSVADIAGGATSIGVIGHPAGFTIEKTTGSVAICSIEAINTIPIDGDCRICAAEKETSKNGSK